MVDLFKSIALPALYELIDFHPRRKIPSRPFELLIVQASSMSVPIPKRSAMISQENLVGTQGPLVMCMLGFANTETLTRIKQVLKLSSIS